LHVDQKTVPAFDAVITCSDDRRRMAIALINRHPAMPASWKLNLGDSVNPAGATATILSGDSPDAFNGVDKPNRVIPVRHDLTLEGGQLLLPPHSIAIVQCGV
jgi:alpha-N-arabinofuranosidase